MRQVLWAVLLFVLSAPSLAQPAVAVRLHPGEDLRAELMRLATDNGWEAACVLTCVGSLQVAHIRFADAHDGTWLREKLEIVSRPLPPFRLRRPGQDHGRSPVGGL